MSASDSLHLPPINLLSVFTYRKGLSTDWLRRVSSDCEPLNVNRSLQSKIKEIISVTDRVMEHAKICYFCVTIIIQYIFNSIF